MPAGPLRRLATLALVLVACRRREPPAPTGPVEWVSDPLPVTTDAEEVAMAIGGTSATDVWAVGDGVFHWDGARWQRVPVAGTTGYYAAISVVAPDDAWAVGANGTIAHWDGHTWTGEFLDIARIGTDPQSRSYYDLIDVAAWPGAVWVTPSRSVAFRYDGHAWSRAPEAPFNVHAMWGAGPADLWLPSRPPTHFDGTRWERPASAVATSSRAVHGTATDDVWLAGWLGNYKDDVGALSHFDGRAWTDQTLPAGTSLLWDVYAAARNEVYAVGAGGTVIVFDGTHWRSSPTGTGHILKNVWAAPGGHAFAVGVIGNHVLRRTVH